MRMTIGEYVKDIMERSPRPLSSVDLTAVSLYYDVPLHPDDVLVLVAGLDDHDLLELAKIRLTAKEER